MTAATLRDHLARLDAALDQPVSLCIYGSGALMLLGQDDRFSVDLDVAGPYSTADEPAFRAAAQRIGLPVNPADDFEGDHIEWVSSLRLCLAPPAAETRQMLWQGARLTVFTLPPADLVASRLIRYDPTDQADIQFLLTQCRLRLPEIVEAVDRLPTPFRDDALVRDNLADLQRDMERWGS